MILVIELVSRLDRNLDDQQSGGDLTCIFCSAVNFHRIFSVRVDKRS